jgi:hypothetical protein
MAAMVLRKTMIMRVRLFALALGAAAAAGALGCDSGVPRGAPVLLNVYWQSGSIQNVVWSPTTDPSSPPLVAPGPVQFNLIFDRVLDGSKVENTVPVIGGIPGATAEQAKTCPPPDGGGAADADTSGQPDAQADALPPAGAGTEDLGPRSSLCPPVWVDWDGMASAASTPPFALQVWYNSVHLTGTPVNASYVYGRELPSFPSSTLLTIHLDHAGLTSQYDEPMIGPQTISVMTAPFTVTVPTVAPTVSTSYWLPLQFNTRPGDEKTTLPAFVHVTAGGADLPFQLVAEPLDATLLYLQPADGDIWPAGSTVAVSIDAALPDAFGTPLGTVVTASFNPVEPSAGADSGVVPGGPDAAADGGVDVAVDVAVTPGSGGDDAAADGGVDVAVAPGGDDAAADGGVDSGLPE